MSSLWKTTAIPAKWYTRIPMKWPNEQTNCRPPSGRNLCPPEGAFRQDRPAATFYIREAVEEHLRSMEDLYAAEQAMIEHRRSGEQSLSLDELDAALARED